ncbi:hypothetical protein F0U59_08650 [Archangium gephyra]|nr:hypothetical protein F0U59_08650 [Archangium gephyra]
MGARAARQSPSSCELLHPPGALLGRPPSAALLGPCAPALSLNRAPIRPMRRTPMDMAWSPTFLGLTSRRRTCGPPTHGAGCAGPRSPGR